MSLPAPVLPDPVATIPQAKLRGLATLFAFVAVASTVALAVGYYTAGPKQFAFSYNVAFVYLGSLLIGSLFWVMIHHLTAAGWSVVIRRLFENNTRAFPIFILLALPLIANLPSLFKWANPEAIQYGVHGAVQVEQDPLWQEKKAYLNPYFFVGRLVLYYLIWLWLSQSLANWSVAQDTTGDSKYSRWMRGRSAPGLILLALTSTFFVFDWMMSLDYHWFSTIYGVYYWAGTINCSMALMVLTVLLLQAAGYFRNTITIEHIHDMGKIMFGFTVFWTYIGFSQYFLYWYANIPEETLWSQHRRVGAWNAGNWNTASWVLFFGKFIIPFFFLLRRKVKRTKSLMFIAALWIMAFHYFDLYWQIMPSYMNEHDHPSGVTGVYPHWMDFAALAALFSIPAFLVVYREWPARPMIPVGDPRLGESLHFKNYW